MQRWVARTGARVLVLFEGRDAAGKGGLIKRITKHLPSRAYRIVALDKPTERERSQWYFQRYVAHLPASGEIVLFDRSWYNRAGLERVNGYCTEAEANEFLRSVPQFEGMLVRSGILLFKFFLSITKEEQARRLKKRREDPLKQGKLTALDRRAQADWFHYSRAEDEMFRRTATSLAPWILVDANSRIARGQTLRFLLSRIDYEDKRVDLVKVDPTIIRHLPEGGKDHDNNNVSADDVGTDSAGKLTRAFPH